MTTTTVRIAAPTPHERALLNILTTDERLQALLDAARAKAQALAAPDAPPTAQD